MATLDHVVSRYGRLTGRDLIRLTQSEAPWRDISERDDPSLTADPEISLAAMQAWFENDEEHRRRTEAVRAIEARKDVYSFAAPEVTPELMAAIDRARHGERIQHSRPE